MPRELLPQEVQRLAAIFEEAKTRPSMGDLDIELQSFAGRIVLTVMAWDGALSRDGKSPVGHMVSEDVNLDHSLPALERAMRIITEKLCGWALQYKST